MRLIGAVLAGAACASALCWTSAFAQPAPAEVFGNLPAISDAAISPNGEMVALAMFEGGQARVVVHNLNDGRPVRLLTMREEQQLSTVDWADDQHVAILIRQTFPPYAVLPSGYYYRGRPRRVDFWRTAILDITTGNVEMPTTDTANPWRDQGASLIAPISGDPGSGRLIGSEPGSQSLHATVFRVDLATGRVRPMAPRGVNADTVDFVLDEAGAPLTRGDSDEETNRWSLFVYDGETPRLLAQDVSEDGDPPVIAGPLPDGRLVTFEESPDKNFTVLSTVRRTDGVHEVLFRQDHTDISGVVLDPWTRHVVGATWTTEETHQSFFEADLEAVRVQLDALGFSAARLMSWSRDRRRFLVYAEVGLDGGGYYIFDRDATQLRLLGMLYPVLAQRDQGVRQAITYRARDGVRIPAYLTLPPGIEARNLPLVLFPHGGPHARDRFDFDWWAAFMASRGYAVLQPNFRGSTGYGRAWEEAGRRQWGGLMQTDIEDGVTALGRAGLINPERVCIVGASDGGYAALAGATLTPDKYKCAASIAGVSDLNTFTAQRIAQAGGSDSSLADFWALSIGDRTEDRDAMRAASPYFLADRVQIPILLIHGTDDTVVPIDQSRRMARALQSAGKNVRMVELRGDDHWLSDAPTRIQMLRELEDFLAQHLAPAPISAPVEQPPAP